MQKNAKVVSIDDYEDVPAYDEGALKKAVANHRVTKRAWKVCYKVHGEFSPNLVWYW